LARPDVQSALKEGGYIQNRKKDIRALGDIVVGDLYMVKKT